METKREKPLTIDEAINACDLLIKDRKQAARFILIFIYTVTVAFIFAITYYLGFNHEAVAPTTTYAGFGLYVMFFGVMMSIYRLHLTEGAKAEHAKIGFLRIRIAANNTSSGFQSEVREALTKGAFDYQQSNGFLTKKGKIESPLLGHPTSDLTTAVVNKLLDNIEITLKKK